MYFLSLLLMSSTTIAQQPTQEQINYYIQQLKREPQRSQAINSLVTIGKLAVPALITALQNKDPEVRESATSALSLMGNGKVCCGSGTCSD